ncbi:MAG: ATP-binding cassette domain-containing protein, partial [Vicinamibacterales bacterium]
MTQPTTSQESATAAASDRTPVVAFDDVSFGFDDKQVLDHVSFEVPRGAMRFLLGASGSGKSVMLKLVLGLLRPDSG